MFIYNKSGKGREEKKIKTKKKWQLFSLSCTKNTEQIYRQFTQRPLTLTHHNTHIHTPKLRPKPGSRQETNQK